MTELRSPTLWMTEFSKLPGELASRLTSLRQEGKLTVLYSYQDNDTVIFVASNEEAEQEIRTFYDKLLGPKQILNALLPGILDEHS